MHPDYQKLVNSLETIAEKAGDITDLFFKNYFDEYPEHQPAFKNGPTIAGHMLAEIFDTILALSNDEPWVDASIRNNVMAHAGYGDFSLDDFSDMLKILETSLQSVGGVEWTKKYAGLWKIQFAKMLELLTKNFK